MVVLCEYVCSYVRVWFRPRFVCVSFQDVWYGKTLLLLLLLLLFVISFGDRFPNIQCSTYGEYYHSRWKWHEKIGQEWKTTTYTATIWIYCAQVASLIIFYVFACEQILAYIVKRKIIFWHFQDEFLRRKKYTPWMFKLCNNIYAVWSRVDSIYMFGKFPMCILLVLIWV